MMDTIYFIWVDEDNEKETFAVNAIVSNIYYERFDLCVYLN